MAKFNYNPDEDKDRPNHAEMMLHFSRGHKNLHQKWDDFGTHIKCSCGKTHHIPLSEISKEIIIMPYTKKQNKKTIKLLDKLAKKEDLKVGIADFAKYISVK